MRNFRKIIIFPHFQKLFEHPWIMSPQHWAICRNNTFWSTFKNSHCRRGKISCNGNIGPGFCTSNITWQEGKSINTIYHLCLLNEEYDNILIYFAACSNLGREYGLKCFDGSDTRICGASACQREGRVFRY